MGMSYWQKTGLIILPQALKLVIPPTMNTFIGLFKDTTLIIMISMFDFLGAVRLASNDTVWRPFYVEGLVFAAIVYFIMCYAMAAYARHLDNAEASCRAVSSGECAERCREEVPLFLG